MTISEITFYLVAGTVGMLLLAFSMILFVIYYQKRLLSQRLTIQELKSEEQQKLLDASIEGMENERRRIAQDLHDDIGAMLSTARMGLHQVERSLDRSSSHSEMAAETKRLMDDIINTVRKLSHNLLPASLENFGFSDAIEELTGKMRNSTGLSITFNLEGETPRFDKKKELNLYRVVQELLNNIIKHAQATEIAVNVRQKAKRLQVTVSDNGSGFHPDWIKQNPQAERGLGLYNIDSRLALLKATINWDARRMVGTKVTIDLDT